jgi:hypothetical protein
MSIAVPRITAPPARIVLVALVVGLAVGAIACAAALAGGSGHRVHAQGTDSPLVSAPGPHIGREAAEPGARHGDPLIGPAAPLNHESSESTGILTESHPGMACVVTIDLDVAEAVTPAMAGRFDIPRPTLPVDCVVDLDPPVPRHS